MKKFEKYVGLVCNFKVTDITKRMKENRLRWFELVNQ